jgi:hypothetical protein
VWLCAPILANFVAKFARIHSGDAVPVVMVSEWFSLNPTP